MTAQSVTPVAAAEQEQPWKNLFGVCAAIGEDFGFNPLWLRIALGVSMLVAPVAVVAVYVWMGVAVLASRALFPKRRRKRASAPALAAVDAPAVATPATRTQQEPELPLAA